MRERHPRKRPRMSDGVEAFVYRASQNFDKGYPKGTACMFEQQFGKTRQAVAALRRGFVKVVGSRYIATVPGLKALGLRK